MSESNQEQQPEEEPKESQSTSSDGTQNDGSEPNEHNSASDEKNKPTEKKPRMTDAERLVHLKQKLKKIADAERTVRGRLRKSDNKELAKLKVVLGDCCLRYIGGSPKPANADGLVKMLRGRVSDCNKEWLTINLDRLLVRHATPPQEGGDTNGESPSQV